MNRLLRLLLLGFIFCCFSAQAINIPHEFSWLAGTWQTENQEGIFEENWSKLIKNNMLGSSRFVKHDGSATFYEIMTIDHTGQNWEMHIMHFGTQLKLWHQKPLVYRLINQTCNKLVFENVGGDPVRYIVYEKTAKETMLVRLLSERKETKEEFKFNRLSA